MTSNQIKYWQNVETQRSNLANEGIRRLELEENKRANVAREVETNRSNLAKEEETKRSNLERERETRDNNSKTQLIRSFEAGSKVGSTFVDLIDAIIPF